MTDQLEKMVDTNLKLEGKKKENFLRQAKALRANINLRQKQQKEQQKVLCL